MGTALYEVLLCWNNDEKKNLIVKSFDVSFPPKLIGTT